jgi:hypothetical protein
MASRQASSRGRGHFDEVSGTQAVLLLSYLNSGHRFQRILVGGHRPIDLVVLHRLLHSAEIHRYVV